MPAAISSPIQPSWFQSLLPLDLPTPEPSPAPEPRPAPSKLPATSPREFGFGILSAICQVELVDRVIAECGRLEKRCRLLPARLMVYAVLMMCLSPNLGYDKLMHHLAQAAGGPGSWSPPHKSTFAKARLRLGWEVFERLFRALARPLADPQRDSGCFWRGRRLVAIDGTTIEVALVPEIEKEFGGPVTSGGAAAGLPQARAVALTECGTHALLDIEAGHHDLASTPWPLPWSDRSSQACSSSPIATTAQRIQFSR